MAALHPTLSRAAARSASDLRPPPRSRGRSCACLHPGAESAATTEIGTQFYPERTHPQLGVGFLLVDGKVAGSIGVVQASDRTGTAALAPVVMLNSTLQSVHATCLTQAKSRTTSETHMYRVGGYAVPMTLTSKELIPVTLLCSRHAGWALVPDPLQAAGERSPMQAPSSMKTGPTQSAVAAPHSARAELVLIECDEKGCLVRREPVNLQSFFFLFARPCFPLIVVCGSYRV
jgi:hypothetical protein